MLGVTKGHSLQAQQIDLRVTIAESAYNICCDQYTKQPVKLTKGVKS